MFSQSLTQFQKALTAKADSVQREFISISEELTALSRKVIEADPEDRPPLEAQQVVLRERRAVIAEDVNVWRDRAKDVINQPGHDVLQTYIREILETSQTESNIQAAGKHVIFILNATDEELAALAQPQEEEKELTQAGRLIQRARREYDLRGEDPAPRQRTAVEFANRQNMIQDDAAIAELEATIYDPDKFVREVVLLTLIQIHRTRALRLSELEPAYQSVLRLVRMNHPGTIAVLSQIVETPRTGFVHKSATSDEMVEVSNSRLRVAALKRLVEWHTPEARRAVETQQFSRDEEVSYLAQRALETFPGEWKAPIRGTGLLM